LLDPPDFPEPGSDASLPEDRSLFHEKSEEEVAQEVDEAERILNGEIPPESRTITEAPFNAKETYDEINETGVAFETQMLIEEIKFLLEQVEDIAPAHAKRAVQAGQAGLASDFNTLANAARHITRRLNGKYTYLRKS